MKDMFDMNLLSQVQALDRKLNISKEHLHLKRKSMDDDTHRGAYRDPKKPMKNTDNNKNLTEEKQDTHINITV